MKEIGAAPVFFILSWTKTTLAQRQAIAEQERTSLRDDESGTIEE